MAYLEQKEVVCRNCGHKQNYNVYDRKFPTTERAVAACKSCGFKSVWFDEDLKLSDEMKEIIKQLEVQGIGKSVKDSLEKVDSVSQKVYTVHQVIEMIRDRGLYITSSPMFMLTAEELKEVFEDD